MHRRSATISGGAELIIHNAPFDIGFLNAELARLGMPKVEEIAECITDSLVKARDMFPGRRNSLDALCERFEISNAHRTLHGALLDSELLAEVYLAMTRGQETLEIGGMSIEEEEAAAKAGTPVQHPHRGTRRDRRRTQQGTRKSWTISKNPTRARHASGERNR